MVTRTVVNYLSRTDDLSNIKEIISKHHQFSHDEESYVFSNQRFINVLIEDYKKHGNIIVAFDFDDTINPSSPEYPCDLVIELLQICSNLGFIMICYTARSALSDIEAVKEHCKTLGIRCDYINEDCDMAKAEFKMEHAKKIFYNIFLDDRAGLKSAYEILWGFVEWFINQRVNDIDARKEGY